VQTYIVVPTYNEKENMPALIEGVFQNLPEAHLVVVDDHSPDGTGGLVESLKGSYEGRLHCIRRIGNKGLGPSCIEGFRFALAQDADRVVQMDADGSHAPDNLGKLLEESCDFDLVVGSRYVPGGSTPDWPWPRRVLSRSANFYARKALGLPVKDITAGFKCYSRRALQEIDLNTIRCNGYGFQIETIFRIFHKGFSIAEIPITFRDRTLGESKMGLHIAWEGFVEVLRLRLQNKSI